MFTSLLANYLGDVSAFCHRPPGTHELPWVSGLSVYGMSHTHGLSVKDSKYQMMENHHLENAC